MMLTGDEGKPVGPDIGRGGLGNGLLSSGQGSKGRILMDRLNVTLACETIMELDDLGRGENDEPDLFWY